MEQIVINAVAIVTTHYTAVDVSEKLEYVLVVANRDGNQQIRLIQIVPLVCGLLGSILFIVPSYLISLINILPKMFQYGECLTVFCVDYFKVF